MKFLRIFFSILILLILVVVLAISALMLFIDPNKLKPIIIEEVHKQTGYTLTIDGKLVWSFYPRLGVKIAHMTMQAPQQTVPFIDLRNVKLGTDLLQLIHGREKLKGDIYIDDVKLMNLHGQNAHIGLRWQAKVLTLQPINVSLYEGTLEGFAHGRNFSDIPAWDWQVKINNAQLKPLVDDINGADSKIKLSGVGQINLQAVTQGKGKEALLRNLNGQGDFNITQGAVEGIDLNYLIQSADALISKQTLTAPTNISETRFDHFSGTAVIKAGVVNTNPIALTSTELSMQGQGKIDLPNQTLDYQLQIMPLHTTKIKGTVPVLISGSLSNPSVRLDTSALNATFVKEKLDKVKSKIQEQINQLPDKADKFLQKFLGK